MKKSIIFSSATGNTKQLAETINAEISADYCGKADDSALDSDVIFVGFWAKGFSCDDGIAEFLKKIQGKKVFLFGTAGYDDTEEYFNKVLGAAKEHLSDSNTLVGEFMCMGKVSPQKQESLKEMGKYDGMKDNLARGISHPDQNDLDQLKAAVKKAL
ncbi:MAG: flavodoxin family protein [Eubacteriales bacterium]